MKTKYLIWKKPSCDGINPQWQDITGEEFYSLVSSPEAKGRYFVKLQSINEDGSDGIIVMEATKEEYVTWRKEKDHSDYIQEHCGGYAQVSYHALESEDGGCYGCASATLLGVLVINKRRRCHE